MKVARDGQHSGNESTAFVNFVPWFTSSFRTFGICAGSAAAWSSVITTRMFGRPSWPALAGRAAAGAAHARSAMATARMAHVLIGPTVQRVSHGVNFSVRLRAMATSYKATVRQTRQESRERIV